MKNNPTIQTIDADFSKGRLNHIQTISLEDTAKFHGHLCDGLIVGFLGLKEALQQLYPDGIIDRTNTRIVSKSSPCLSDIAIYLSGGRYQFNTFYVDNSIGYNFIVQRIDNGFAVGVNLAKSVKPSIIDELGNKAVAQELSPCEIDELKKMEDAFSEKLLTLNPKEAFIIETIKSFNWQPILDNNFIKSDIINKSLPSCNYSNK